MAIATGTTASIPWWKEPTKDQWIAWWAAWMGWTLDAFDFTIFLLIMLLSPETKGHVFTSDLVVT
jgi:SHS family lactate transporter-like MFS transporter